MANVMEIAARPPEWRCGGGARWIDGPADLIGKENTMARKFVSLLVLGVCAASWSLAAGGSPVKVASPAPRHRFLDSQNVTMLAISAIIMAADVATTKRALQVPGAYEANPLTRSPGALISLKVAGVGAGLGLAYALHKSGHHKAERLVPIFFSLPSAVSAAHNAGVH